jgi:hypothetical protein
MPDRPRTRVLLTLIGVQMGEEAAVRRHHVDRVAGLQRVEREVREAPAAHALDADAQFAVAIVIGDADADRIERRVSSPSMCVFSVTNWPCVKR